MKRFWNGTNAVLTAFLVMSQLTGAAYGQTIPGMGASTPPKVMVVFDTSNSMRHLPTFDPNSGFSTPCLNGRAPDGGCGFSYLADDWNSLAPTAPCDNRFCIAKSVLSNVMPSYADSIEVGLAGYYQYRTSYTPPAGSTSCMYDVLAPAGQTVTLPPITTAGLGGTTGIPPTIAAYCDPSTHQYPISLVSTDAGVAFACTRYRIVSGDTVGTATPTQVGNAGLPAGCSDTTIPAYARSAPTTFYPGGVSAATTQLYVRFPTATASCAAARQLFYGRLGTTDYFSDGSPAPAPASASVVKVANRGLVDGTFSAINTANAGYTWAASCVASGTTPTANGGCALTTTGTMVTGAELAGINVNVDAGASFIYSGVTYTYDAGQAPLTATRTANTDGGCTWPDGGAAAVGATAMFYTSGANPSVPAGFTGFAGAMCSTSSAPGRGCRVVVKAPTVVQTPGTFSPGPNTKYTVAAPPSDTGTCSVTGLSQSLTYTAGANLTGSIPAAAFGGSCPGGAITGLASTATYGGQSITWNSGTPAPTPFDFATFTSAPTSSTFTYPAAPAGYALNAGQPVNTSTATLNLTAYGQTCPGGSVGSTATINDGGLAGCSSGSPCQVTLLSMNADAGSNPGAQFFFSNAILPYTFDGGTYNPVGSVGVVGSPGSPLYEAAKSGSSCNGSLTLTSGETLSGASSNCSVSRPCNVQLMASPNDEKCVDISSGTVVPCGSVTSDSTVTRTCEYQGTRYQYAPNGYGTCTYQEKSWTYTKNVCNFTVKQWFRCDTAGGGNTCLCQIPTNVCNYEMPRFTYTYPSPYKYCQVTPVQYTYSGTSGASYVYSYQTKGGEYLGSATRPATANLNTRNWCELNPPQYGSYQADCPDVVNDAGVGMGATCGAGRSCKLRWRGSYTGSDGGVFNNGRLQYYLGGWPSYETYSATTYKCLAPDAIGKVATPAVTQWLPSSGTLADGGVPNWCQGIGSNGATQIRLRADWYDPSHANVTSSPYTDLPYADLAVRQSRKYSGWSRNESDAGPSDLFVDLGLGTSTLGAVQAALGPCVRPTDLSTATGGGLCMGDQQNCGPAVNGSCQNVDAGMTDFTPLYGSLVNARGYMANQLANDGTGDWECRDYYVLMVSDGLESTPSGYGQTDLQAAVTALRSLDAGTRVKDVKTFVVGFGAGLTGDGGVSDLDVIARTGGTAMLLDTGNNLVFDNDAGRALSAQDRTELQNVLNVVFSNITAGHYARSRPTVSTDGNRIYQAFFERGAVDGGSPEWRGDMQAFQLDLSGALVPMWNYRDKLDLQASRSLKALLPTGTDGGFAYTDFIPSNGALTTYMDTFAPDSGVQTVRFARNDGLGTGPDETFLGIPMPRHTRAGAFVFSSPVVVAKPPFDQSYGGLSSETAFTSYGAYRTTWAGRPTRVIIGSNDGFLHGVMDVTDAGTCSTAENTAGCPNGSEAWGVVPNEVLQTQHNIRMGAVPLVDGTSAVADVCFGPSNQAEDCALGDWRTVAITPLRAGGQSVSAFNLTDGGFPEYMWQFNDSASDNLGYTYSTPTIGRVSVGGHARWVAFMGGGVHSNAFDGDALYVLDVQTGKYDLGGGVPAMQTKWDNALGFNADFPARPATFKPFGSANVDSVYYPNTAGTIWGQRTRATGNTPKTDWQPRAWYDPGASTDSDDLFGNPNATIWYLDKDPTSPTYQQKVDTECTLPIGGTNHASPVLGVNCNALTKQPFYNRAKVGLMNGVTFPSAYIGTGDSLNINDTTQRNYFFAVFDSGFAVPRPTHDGQTMFAYIFDQGEKVLGEPAMVGGAVVVATYRPPSGGLCSQFGDSFLYAFDPRTGDPRQVLRDPSVATTTYRSVIKLDNAGALSDLLVINGGVYYANSKGAVGKIEAKQTGLGGRVQGWRRVR